MGNRFDFEEIASDLLSRAEGFVAELLPNGQREGHEWVVGDLSGNPGDSCKINLRNGKWGDFATGDIGGDLLSLVKAVKGFKTMTQAAEWVTGVSANDGMGYQPKMSKPKRKKEDEFKAIYPVPEANQLKDLTGLNHYRLGSPSRYWVYRDQAGEMINVVCRFEKEGGGKEVCPFTFGETEEKGRKWYWKQIPDNRPLYGLDRLDRPKHVIIVEGEKAADAANEILDNNWAVLSWPGGGKAVHKADWSVLKDRKVIIVADGDEVNKKSGKVEGHETAKRIAKELDGIAEKIWCVFTEPVEGIKGWDAADAQEAGWTGGQFLQWADKNKVEYEPEEKAGPVPEEPPAPASPEDYEGGNWEPDYGEPIEYNMNHVKGKNINPLGYDGQYYYYYSDRKEQIVDLTAAQHTGVNLCQLMPLDYWKTTFLNDNGTAVSWIDAADYCMDLCHRAEVYNEDNVRGRGGWRDVGRNVQHKGNMLIVDGEPTRFQDFDSEFIYVKKKKVRMDETLPPLTAKECEPIMQLIKGARWEHELMAYYFAGWCVIAPFCGMLPWRPHLWVTGAAGSGKSWILEKVAHRLLGDWAFFTQFESTEAGIRQKLRNDALPVIFDEVKSEGRGENERIERVLGLMRQSSSDNNSEIVKGTTGGSSMSFKIRSCFLLASISLGIKQHADETRISVLNLMTPPTDPETQRMEERTFQALEELRQILTPEFVQRLHNRTVRLMHVILENAKTFTIAAARVLGSKRAGDQAGFLLAGVYSLHSSKLIDLDDAIVWVNKYNMESTATHSEPDYIRCFNYLMQTSVRVTVKSGSAMDFTIGELVEICRATQVDGDTEAANDLNDRDAERALSRRGIRLTSNKDALVIANSHKLLADIFRETTWSANWGRSLKQNPDSGDNNNTAVHFSGNVTSKVTVVHLDPSHSTAEVVAPIKLPESDSDAFEEEDEEIPF